MILNDDSVELQTSDRYISLSVKNFLRQCTSPLINEQIISIPFLCSSGSDDNFMSCRLKMCLVISQDDVSCYKSKNGTIQRVGKRKNQSQHSTYIPILVSTLMHEIVPHMRKWSMAHIM